MSVGKISFTSSILSDMTAKAAAFQENKQPEQPASVTEPTPQPIIAQPQKQEPQPVISAPAKEIITDEPKNKRKRNTIIGLSAVAILIGLGVAGRKGKLGPKLQKFLGGAEHAAGKSGDDITTGLSPDVSGPAVHTLNNPAAPDIKTFRIEPADTKAAISKLDRKTQNRIAEINSTIDRDIPLLDDSLKTITVPTKKECMEIIEKDVDINAIKRSECMIGDDGTIYYDTVKDGYKISVVFNKDKSFKSFTKFDLNNNYKTVTYIDFGEGKAYNYNNEITGIYCALDKEGNPVFLGRKISPNITLWYDNNKQLDHVLKNMTTDPTKTLSSIHYENGKISRVFYYDTNTNHIAKLEWLNDTGKIAYEKYTVDGKEIEIHAG